jgi:hypothetical protein
MGCKGLASTVVYDNVIQMWSLANSRNNLVIRLGLHNKMTEIKIFNRRINQD